MQVLFNQILQYLLFLQSELHPTVGLYKQIDIVTDELINADILEAQLGASILRKRCFPSPSHSDYEDWFFVILVLL